LNKIFPAFDSLNRELSPGFHLVDTFPDYFSFYLANQKDVTTKIAHHNKLKNIYENSQDTILIISDVSVKNNIAISVSYIWREYKIIVKTVHYAMNVLSTEAELCAIRCDIS